MNSNNEIGQSIKERQLAAQKTAIHEVVNRYKWDYFLTLTFAYKMYDRIKADSIIWKFVKGLSIASFGKNSKKLIKIMPFIEKCSDGSLHVHALIENPTGRIVNPERKESFDLRDSVIAAWKRAGSETANPALSCNDQNEWLKKIDDTEGLTNYLLKQLSIRDDEVVRWNLCSPEGRKR